MTVARLWRGRRYRALLVGQGISALGDWMGTFAFMALVLHESGSPTAVGGILALRLFPATIGGPLAARTASRWDRRRTMVGMDIARAVMIALVPLIRALWWIYLLAFFVEVASLVFLPARDASIPDLVDDDLLPLANGLVLGSSYGTIPLGAGAFAAVAALPGATLLGRAFATVFWIDAATFLVSAAAIGSITGLGRAPTRSPDADASVDEDTAEAAVRFRDAFAIPLVRAVMPATAAIALGLGALFSLGIVFVREVLEASDAQFGVLIALFGVGAVVGLGALQAVAGRDQLAATRVGATVLGGVVVVFSLAPTITLAYVGAGAFGAAVSWTLASGMGVLQSSLEGRRRVVAFAAFHAVIRSGLAFAAIAAGVAGELVGRVRWPIVGTLAPARLILMCSGLLVLLSAARVRVPSERVAPERSPHGRRDRH
jgi:predicted MFS family arabinose efflux permease